MNDIIHRISTKPRQTGLVGASFLLIYFFVNTMAFPLDHNEHMYVTAAYLLESMELYRDFAFLQMPYWPILYHAILKITQAEHLLLIGRICTLLFTVACCAILWLIIYRMTRDYAISLFAILIFGFSYYIQDISAEASNYMMPMASSLMAFLIFQHVLIKPDLRLPQMFCAGLLLGLSVGTKLYYAALVLPFLACSVIFPTYDTLKEKLFHQTFPLLVGLIAALVPVVHYVTHYPEAFYFNNFQYHVLNSQWRGYDVGSNIGERIEAFFRILSIYPANVAFNVLIALIVIRSLKTVPRLTIGRLLHDPMVVLSGSLFVAAFLVALTPLPIFVYYFAACFPFAIILGCSLLKRSPFKTWPGSFKFVAAIAILFMMGSAAVNFSSRLGAFTTVRSWTGFKIHDISMIIKSQADNVNAKSPIATLSPIYAIESRMPVYPQFSTGPFVFRVGSRMSAEELELIKAVAPNTLSALFAKKPPGAIIIGQEYPVEIPLITYGSKYTKTQTEVGPVWVMSAGTPEFNPEISQAPNDKTLPCSFASSSNVLLPN